MPGGPARRRRPSINLGSVIRDLWLHGPGRAATSLGVMHMRAGGRIVGLSGGSEAGAASARSLLPGVPWTVHPDGVCDGVLLVVGVRDDALDACVQDVAGVISGSDVAAVHLSGTRGRDALSPLASVGLATGAFHPLCTFPGRDPGDDDLRGSIVAVEAEEPLAADLFAFATALSGRPFILAPEARALYHLGAANASNSLLATVDLAAAALAAAGVPDDLAMDGICAIAHRTLDNAARDGITTALTGPVARGDVTTLERHLHALEGSLPERRTVYLAFIRALVDVVQRRDPSAASAVRSWLEGVTP